MLQRVPWWVWAGVVPIVIAIAAVLYFLTAYRPPREFVFATGREGGAYYAFAQEYQQRVAEKGYTMSLLPTAGSIAILQALNAGEAEVGFVQGGVSAGVDTTNLVSLGSVFYEPLWIFYRPQAFDQTPEHLRDLKGKTIAVGENGSGSALLARQLLTDNNVTEETSQLLPLGAAEGYTLLQEGNIDVLLFVSAPAAPMVREMLADPKIALLDMTRTLAYHRRYPFLMPVTLAEGSLDLAENLPSSDRTLLAAAAKLVARSDIPPDIMRLVLSEAQEIHGQGGLLEEQAEFPSTKYIEIPMAEDAKHFLEVGPTGLERYLPYWLASRLEWFIFVILPILVLAYPIVRSLPTLFDNVIRTQFYRWYAEVRKVEQQLPTYSIEELDAKIEWLDDLHEFLTRRLRVPMFYLGEFYQLRSNLSIVIQRLEKRRQVLQNQDMASQEGSPSPAAAEDEADTDENEREEPIMEPTDPLSWPREQSERKSTAE
jgi:TRAP transporter TAXI family solute receptor